MPGDTKLTLLSRTETIITCSGNGMTITLWQFGASIVLCALFMLFLRKWNTVGRLLFIALRDD
ncbi:MAG: hypothetical protein K2W82_08465 [Candidatus Obscuribacterales bacterium]|nr:hypothetical protein [Candidatus Obscuribacterales bacterium]